MEELKREILDALNKVEENDESYLKHIIYLIGAYLYENKKIPEKV